MRTETDRAYLAGLLDGEGHIGITLLNQRNGGKRHELAVFITNTKLDVLRELAGEWDAKSVNVSDQRNGWQPKGDVRWTSDAALRMLREVQPYLRIKREQCAIALRFGETIRPAAHRTKPLTAEEWAVREELRLAIRALNKRSPLNPQTPPQAERPPLTCQYCGTEFTSYQKRRKYCSQTCNLKAGRDAYEERTRSVKNCRLCGTEFLARATQEYCSIKCGRAMQPAHSTKPTGNSWRDKQRARTGSAVQQE